MCACSCCARSVARRVDGARRGEGLRSEAASRTTTPEARPRWMPNAAVERREARRLACGSCGLAGSSIRAIRGRGPDASRRASATRSPVSRRSGEPLEAASWPPRLTALHPSCLQVEGYEDRRLMIRPNGARTRGGVFGMNRKVWHRATGGGVIPHSRLVRWSEASGGLPPLSQTASPPASAAAGRAPPPGWRPG